MLMRIIHATNETLLPPKITPCLFPLHQFVAWVIVPEEEQEKPNN
jgi:hypothetical protein